MNQAQGSVIEHSRLQSGHGQDIVVETILGHCNDDMSQVLKLSMVISPDLHLIYMR